MEMNFLHFVDFSKFNEWDVKRYIYTSSHQFEKTHRLGDLLLPFRQQITHEQVKKSNLQIISKIDFSGELHLRDKSEIDTYKGNVFLVPQNHLIYSKINVKHGCIYFNHQEEFVVSNEYPCFSFDTNKINGHFLILLLRSNYFKKLLNAKTNGIGKARVKSNEFLDLQIPLPDINIQKALVQAYQDKMAKADELEKQANQIDSDIEHYLFEQLGIEIQQAPKAQTGKLRFVGFRDLNTWVYNPNEIDFFHQLNQSRYPIKSLGQVFEFVVRSWKKLETEKQYIEIGSIDSNLGIVETKTIYSNKAPSRATQIVKTGDFIIGMTRPYLKKFTIIEQEFNDFVASSGFSVIQENNLKYNLFFLDEVLRSKIGVRQFEIKMTGALYPAITQGELEEIKIPLPPLETQTQIANHIQAQKQQQKNHLTTAAALRLDALAEFEGAIFQ